MHSSIDYQSPEGHEEWLLTNIRVQFTGDVKTDDSIRGSKHALHPSG